MLNIVINLFCNVNVLSMKFDFINFLSKSCFLGIVVYVVNLKRGN